MADNPFEPPAAEVRDPAPPGGPAPKVVQTACTLVLASLAIGVVSLLPGLRPDGPGAEPVPWSVTVAFVLFFGGLTLWLVNKVRGRRNWGRWALLAFLALGWWLGLDQITESFALSPLFGFIDMACIGMELVAAVLLFSPAAGRWFA